jgi:hypothetical protein
MLDHQAPATMHGHPRRTSDMETGYTLNDDDGHQLHWMEDFDDLSVDDLRELPHHLQLGMDLSVYE